MAAGDQFANEVHQCRILRRDGKWGDIFQITDPIVQDSTRFTHDPESAEWQILEEHAIALYNLDRKTEARDIFERILEYHLSDEDVGRTLTNFNMCPAPPEKWFSWKKYLLGLLMAALLGSVFLMRTCHVGN